MEPHSSTLAWKIPWMEEPSRLQSMESLRVGHDWATSLSLFTFMHWRRKWQPTPVFLPWRIPGMGEPGGLPSTGSHRVRHDWSNLAAAAVTVLYKKDLDQSWSVVIKPSDEARKLSLKRIFYRSIFGVFWMRNCILFSLSNTVNLSNYCHAAVTVQLCPTLCKPMDIACQAPLSMGFSRQEYWSGLPFLPPGDLPGPGIEPKSPALTDGFFTTKPLGKPNHCHTDIINELSFLFYC